jgi:hypothetical protein
MQLKKKCAFLTVTAFFLSFALNIQMSVSATATNNSSAQHSNTQNVDRFFYSDSNPIEELHPWFDRAYFKELIQSINPEYYPTDYSQLLLPRDSNLEGSDHGIFCCCSEEREYRISLGIITEACIFYDTRRFNFRNNPTFYDMFIYLRNQSSPWVCFERDLFSSAFLWMRYNYDPVAIERLEARHIFLNN